MKTIFKNILAILGGVVIGMVVNMGLIITGNQLIPFEDEMNPMNAMNWELKYFIFPSWKLQLVPDSEVLHLYADLEPVLSQFYNKPHTLYL